MGDHLELCYFDDPSLLRSVLRGNVPPSVGVSLFKLLNIIDSIVI